jgi:hypothetical protein
MTMPLEMRCRVWNYGKTPSRGVQELECYLDEQLVWKVGGHCDGPYSGGSVKILPCRLTFAIIAVPQFNCWRVEASLSGDRAELLLLLLLLLQGLLQLAPESLDGKDDFSQVLCFSDDALQEAAAASRRRAVLRRPQGGLASGRQPTAGSKGGVAPGAEGVEEWCQRQEAVVLVNQGQFVAFPPDGGSTRTARPVTAVTVA